MKFRTEITIPKPAHRIEHPDKLFLIGSCFAEHMANKLQIAGFSVLNNPFGELYNPVSIRDALERMAGFSALGEEDFVFRDGLWHSFYHHSSFSAPDKQQLQETIRQAAESGAQFLRQARYAFVTLGTAYVYRYRATGKIVANCHKLPADRFDRFRLSLQEAEAALRDAVSFLRRLQPDMRIIFTVSPIRHLKDGLVENQRSKAVLLLAVERVVRELPDCAYFPGYEILMDDLRDYRFYADNLTHPAPAAVEYIWEKFSETYFTAACRAAVLEVEKLNRSVAHRPLHPCSEAFQRFAKQQLNLIARLKEKFSYLDLSRQEQHFRSFLNNSD
ncbi:MAG TPA: GSCFA domain protein [Caldithrix abyssi]|uniref:GSCFA domain protein n=1 Tax=Caldithrix abyssi TaxID=187145 RepID=A0A7V5PPM1_CALAY|nr:GSCFA domain protein [Caldithrix abyssi]